MFEWVGKTIMNLFYKNLEPHLKKKVAHHFFSTNSQPDFDSNKLSKIIYRQGLNILSRIIQIYVQFF
jgi:hypothetical protein